MAKDEFDDARLQLLRVLMDKVAEENYPSATIMDTIEELMIPQELPVYLFEPTLYTEEDVARIAEELGGADQRGGVQRADGVHQRAGRFEEADREIDVALELDPESWEVNREAARIFYRQNQMAKAARHFETATFSMLTSRLEGQSLVLMESIGRGCPGVAYDIRYGPGTLIRDGVNGYLVPFGDEAAAADRHCARLGAGAPLTKRDHA